MKSMKSMSEPDFICIGPGRCGTTWLQRVLENHPQVRLAQIKETEFFNNNYEKGFNWYLKLFPSKKLESMILGEISNMYYCDETALLRIAADLPNVKIVMGSRDPHSLYLSYLQFGERRGLALEDDLNRHNTALGKIMGSGYGKRQQNNQLSDGDKITLLESVDLKRWQINVTEIFPAENVYIYDYLQLAQDPAGLAEDILKFIGVNPDLSDFDFHQRVNQATKSRSKTLSKFAAWLAYNLRQVGMYSLLNFLKNSEFVKSLVLAKNNGKKSFELTKNEIEVLGRLKSEM